MATTQAQVIAVTDEIHHTVVEIHRDRQPWVSLQETGEDGHQLLLPECGAGRDAHTPVRFGALGGDSIDGGIEGFEGDPCLPKKHIAFVREAEGSRRAIQQTNPQCSLQAGDVLADGGGGQPQRPRSRGKTAGIYCLDEGKDGSYPMR
ncbi:hypothetical protein GCM10023165_44740 [Variovorax defluvii]|uniref:Uncharacterized protein n=1 Tax=Variovorax defluvii TaxID=913761 RepID=A0ABP8I9D9_9BURK